MSLLKRCLVLLAFALPAGNAWAASDTCWLISGEWEMCSEGRVQEFHPDKSKPFFAIEFDRQLVASGWSFKEHPDDIVRLGDRALWRKIKLKLIADLEDMDQDYRSVTHNGVEFIEWSSDTGDDKYIFAAAMVDGREALITTLALKVPADFDIAKAHEVFMDNTRLRPND